ncbi:hypothetical protein L2K70_10935 [Nocardioides KLBMP 9356]|uniref:Secreted protein n=1 Tax=Nocardioides potassii TaxID=2911371 RepID=A0ABS9HCT2_9ACTN|nr:hypothetical protein [Nocardioides potassii]MCF6378117.1 hypothetical protein [Nocardioides potassii]
MLAAIASVLVLAPAPAQAGAGQGTDIDWFWNSGDHDAKARFRSVGEHIDLCKHNVAQVYAEYGIAGGSLTKTYYDGALDTCKDIDWSATDGQSIRVRVCEVKTGIPNDCSDFKYGTA